MKAKSREAINQKQRHFVELIVVEKLPTEAAYEKAYDKPGKHGYRTLKLPQVKAYMKKLRKKAAKRNNITIDSNLLQLEKLKKKGLKQIIDSNGNSVPHDLKIVLSAIAEQNKMLGLYAPTNAQLELNVDLSTWLVNQVQPKEIIDVEEDR